MKMKTFAFAIAAALLAAPAAAQPSGPWDPAARLAAQREALKALAIMDGAWRGHAETDRHPAGFTHTERVGTLLDGTIRLVEGRSYDASGGTQFNAFAAISYDPARKAYVMHSYAMGFAGDFPLAVRPDGYSWTQPAGPGTEIRYTATIKGREWVETGERVVNGGASQKVFEMKLRRLGPTAWPQEGAVGPR